MPDEPRAPGEWIRAAGSSLQVLASRQWLSKLSPWSFTFGIVLAITWLTFSRLLAEGLADHAYQFGKESLRAVQAWENHGFFPLAGFFPLGGTYFGADRFPDPIYQSYPPLYLLPLWLGYRFVGEAGFHLVKVYGSLLLIAATGLLVARIATVVFASRQQENRQLVFVVAYAITITNEALLRYCMIDEPDYLGLIFFLLGVVMLERWWSMQEPRPGRVPRRVILVFLLSAWIYPILGAISFIAAFGLQRLRMDQRLQRGIRSILLPSLTGIALYWIQRLIANVIFSDRRLLGSHLHDRMGLTSSQEFHDGVLDSLEFLHWQKGGSTPASSGVAIPQIVEHYAIWVLGVVLFIFCLTRLRSSQSQLTLILAGAQTWMFIPLLHQSLAMHAWIYAIHFMPAVVLGLVGGLVLLLPRRHGDLFAPVALAGVGMLIWSIQIRFFLVNYL
jgi:hypothetical protein